MSAIVITRSCTAKGHYFDADTGEESTFRHKLNRDEIYSVKEVDRRHRHRHLVLEAEGHGLCLTMPANSWAYTDLM